MTIRVLIADDQEMVRTGLRQMIDADPRMEVVAEAADGREALDLIRRHRPDVCTLDVRMPKMSGLEVTRALLTENERPAVVIVTTYDLEEYLFEALDAQASGFVLKDAASAVVIESIVAAASGDALISPSLTRRLVMTYLQRPVGRDDRLPVLTGREDDVLASVCEGLTNDEIAVRLHISISTVKGHIASLLAKTESSNRVKLVIWAFRHRSAAWDADEQHS